MEKTAKRFYISGQVQGVGYRYFAQRVASRLGIGGYAKNLRDGRVEVYAIADKNGLSQLRRDLERGPQSASVSGVTEQDEAVITQYQDYFTIEYDY